MSADPRVDVVADLVIGWGDGTRIPDFPGFCRAVVAALDAYDETALRERIASEIEDACGEGGVDDDGFHRLLCAPCHRAARIARGTS